MAPRHSALQRTTARCCKMQQRRRADVRDGEVPRLTLQRILLRDLEIQEQHTAHSTQHTAQRLATVDDRLASC